MAASHLGLRRQNRRRARAAKNCCCCKGIHSFCWRCRCGFSICQTCMDENRWGMTCNNITWICPDCGASNGFGNQ